MRTPRRPLRRRSRTGGRPGCTSPLAPLLRPGAPFRRLALARRRGRLSTVALALPVGAVIAAAGLLAGSLVVALAAVGGVVLAWGVWARGRSRVIPLEPGPRPGGGPSGVREPRRPRWPPPAGSMALPVPTEAPEETAASVA